MARNWGFGEEERDWERLREREFGSIFLHKLKRLSASDRTELMGEVRWASRISNWVVLGLSTAAIWASWSSVGSVAIGVCEERNEREGRGRSRV